jgi:hypothetical protein
MQMKSAFFKPIHICIDMQAILGKPSAAGIDTICVAYDACVTPSENGVDDHFRTLDGLRNHPTPLC